MLWAHGSSFGCSVAAAAAAAAVDDDMVAAFANFGLVAGS